MKLKLSEAKKADVLASIQRFMQKEIEVDISDIQAGFILEYFAKEIAPFAYNKGIEDAQKFLLLKAEDLGGTCFEEGLTYWSNPKSGSKPARRKPN